MLALGPLFKEQESFEAHKPFRDQMATLEYETAMYLHTMKFNVLGTHHKGKPAPLDMIEELKSKALEFLIKRAS